MKKTILILILMGVTFMTAAAGQDMKTIFPNMEGWKKTADVALYTADNLYEYINGAADVYLGYDFQELAVLSFENDKKQTLTIDIYRHSNPRNGFGIYSQEKPRKGDFFSIGTQGYYEKGVLNFLKGNYYVKVSGFDLGELDKKVLNDAAAKIAGKLEGENAFPKTIKCFPKKGKKENSESYISSNYNGHAFLHSAFAADYQENNENFQVFIMETENETASKKILSDYLTFVKGKGKTVENNAKNGSCSFQDPYYRSSGTMVMKQKGKYVWGLFQKNPAAATFYIDKIEANLVEAKRF
ncbi:MAG: hypothetical protein GY757_05105 [bacterium]|nr:hypothetical protein [bacterium]